MDFTGKTAVVTGAGSGIGKAVALAFANAGAKVFALDVDVERGAAVASQSSSIGFLRVDVSMETEVAAIAKHIASVSAVDFLVNNAGIEFNDEGNLLTMKTTRLHRIVDVNLWGAIYCSRAFVPMMSQGGKVVFVSSLQASMACLPGTSYQASKAGLIGVAKALAIEVAGRGISVNVVCPGGVATEGMGAVRAGDSGLDDYRRLNPMGRRARADEIAGPVMFLCSKWASYMTGSVLMVDGGMSAVGMPRPGPLVRVQDDPDD